MSDDLKPLLLQLLTKVDAVHADVAGLKGDVAGLKGDVAGLKADVAALQEGQARIEGELRQVKEVVGITRTREIARLDGRIDQLALDVALGRRPAAE